MMTTDAGRVGKQEVTRCPTKKPEMTSSLSHKIDASKLRRLVRLFLAFAVVTGAVTSPETKVTCTDLCIREESLMHGEGGGEVGVGRSGKESLVKATVTIASAMDSDSFFLTRLSSPSGDIYAGYLGDLVHEISQTSSFRFRWSIVEAPEVTGGNRKYPEKWAELTEKLTSEEVNVSVLALTSSIDHDDSLGLTFTRPFLTTTPSLLLKATPPSTAPDPSPLSLEKLLNSRNSSQRQFAVLDETMAVKINSSNSTLYRQLWDGKTPSEVVLTQEEGLRRVREEEGFVLIMESTDAAYLSATEPCDLRFVALSEPETRYVFAGLENSSLVLELDRILADLGRQSPDFFGRLYRKWWSRDDCSTGRVRAGDGGFDGDISADMERIFFTSPVKIFKSVFKPFDGISSSRDWLQAAEITKNPRVSKQVVAQTTEIMSSASSSKPRRRRRTTSATPEPPPVASDDRDDVIGDRSPLSGGAKFRLTGSSSSRDVEIYTINPVLRTRKTAAAIRHDLGQSSRRGETGGPARESRGRDIQNYDLDVPRDKADDSETSTFHSTTSKVNDGRTQGQFVNDIDWFFVTHQPRYPQEMDYDAIEPDYDDDDQKAAYEALDGVADPGGTATLLVVMETPKSSGERNELLVSEMILLNIFSHSVIKLLGAVR